MLSTHAGLKSGHDLCQLLPARTLLPQPNVALGAACRCRCTLGHCPADASLMLRAHVARCS
jgi:hypothetical protein